MKRRSLFILVLFFIPCTTALSSRPAEQQEETESASHLIGTMHIVANDWNDNLQKKSDRLRGDRFRAVVYQTLAKKRREEISDLIAQKQAILTELNQEQISHAQTREQLAADNARLQDKDERIVQLHITIKELNKINEQLIQEQSDYGH